MKTLLLPALILSVGLSSSAIRASVVINEIFYHAPREIEDLEYIELYNAGEPSVDLTGWKFTKGVRFDFSPNTKIEPNGFFVICLNAARFKEFYGFDPNGSFAAPLSKKGGPIELVNAKGEKVDSVKYKDSPPWPTAPDGYSASLERISPFAKSNLPENWAASPLSPDGQQPSGTPGKQNANFSANLPPVISELKIAPASPTPGQPITVEAEAHDKDGLREVLVCYRIAGPGFEQAEITVPMKPVTGHRFAGTIPGQDSGRLVRIRIKATDQKDGQRFYPAPNEPQPAFSCFVHEKFEPGKIPFGFVVNPGPEEFKAAQKQRQNQNSRGFDEEAQRRYMATMTLESGMDIEGAWFELLVKQHLPFEGVQTLRPVITAKAAERKTIVEKTVGSPQLKDQMGTLPELIKTFQNELVEAVKPHLTAEQLASLREWLREKVPAANDQERGWTPERLLRQFLNLESAFYTLSTQPDLSVKQYEKLGKMYQALLQERSGLAEAAKAVMTGKGDWESLQQKIAGVDEAANEKLKTELNAGQLRALEKQRGQANPFMRGRGEDKQPETRQGRSAFVFVDQRTGEPQVFDFVNITPRNAGYKVHFDKEQPLKGMTAINLIFEYNDRFVLAEPLAYEVYRRAGNAAELTDFVRLWIDGELIGYHLLIEQPNRSFLHRNQIHENGNMYKILWYERGVVGQHEKKTNLGSGHDDILQLIDFLEKTKANPDEQWAVIQKHFNVPQVINYFAVNMCLSHWDGFFNNYFTYHDTEGSGKWEMYPWDQDKTWGFHDGLSEGQDFYDMPITFGMEGDRPPGWPKDRKPPRGVAHAWWRPGGYFSSPLLANPHFRSLFLARTKEILETVYTEDVFFPIINEMGERLKEEVRIRATALKQDPDQASEKLQRNLQSLRDHLTKRRKFLLEQPEVRSAGKSQRADVR